MGGAPAPGTSGAGLLMMALDPVPVVCTLSSSARGPALGAAFLRILSPLPTPATRSSRSRAVKQPAPHPCLPSFLLPFRRLRLRPGPFNLHSGYEPASFN